MNDLTSVPDSILGPLPAVVTELVANVPALDPGDIMLVGAFCRDAHHHALGHTFPVTATHDLDLGLALPSWALFETIAEQFTRVGDTGIRFRIAGWPVDVMPFGGVEDPTGTIAPPRRRDPVGVWAFREIFSAALRLRLPTGDIVRCPTVAGYSAAKIGAWLDRSEWHETKDAVDLALTIHWYGAADDVKDRLYDTPDGPTLLEAEEYDLERASARLLGRDVTATVGEQRADEMLRRWPGNARLLARELRFTGGAWPRDPTRRHELLDALTRGLADADA